MDETEFRILETLSQDPGERLSIRALNQEIHRRHGTAHYANTYRTLRRIQAEGVLGLTDAGRARLVSLNLDNPIAIDALSEVEIRKRRALLRQHPGLQPMVDALADLPFPAPACLVDLQRNRALDRAEILAISPGGASVRQATAALSPGLRDRGEALGVRIERGVSYHGIALNVTTDLADYGLLDPCGIPGLAVTTMAVETGRADATRTTRIFVAGVLRTRRASRMLQSSRSIGSSWRKP